MSNAQGGSRSIPITARAQAVPLPVIRVSPVFIGFGDRMIGTPSATQRVTIRNEGGGEAVLALLGPESVSLDYLATSTCGLTLAPQQTCFADVAFRPLGFGPRPGQFRVFSNAAGSPHIVELIGTGCRPFVSTGRRPASQNCAP